MEKTINILCLTVTLAIIATALGAISVGAVGGNRPSVNGQGFYTDAGGGRRTFSFNAVTKQDGAVTGQAVLHNRDSDTFYKVEVNCLQVEGNVATVSGVIKNSNVPGLEGFNSVFRVVDNGEGNNSLPDRISRLLITDEPVDCHSEVGFGLRAIEGGNVQVKP